MKKIIGYLGPEATYSHEVAIWVAGQEFDLLELHPSKFEPAFREKAIYQAVLPVVNAIAGQVPWVLDLLMSNNGDYEITREIIWDIRSHLIGFGKISEITIVCSHPQPLDQCRGFLSKMPGVNTQETSSTSAAVKLVAGKKDPAWAAIGTISASELYGVPVIVRNISDFANNQTRFLVLGGEKSSPTGNDKTSILIGTANKPGALLRPLEVFDALDINMSDLFRLPSPSRKLGECFFLIDVEAHRHDREMSVAIERIKTRVEYLKVLGSYPKADH